MSDTESPRDIDYRLSVLTENVDKLTTAVNNLTGYNQNRDTALELIICAAIIENLKLNRNISEVNGDLINGNGKCYGLDGNIVVEWDGTISCVDIDCNAFLILVEVKQDLKKEDIDNICSRKMNTVHVINDNSDIPKGLKIKIKRNIVTQRCFACAAKDIHIIVGSASIVSEELKEYARSKGYGVVDRGATEFEVELPGELISAPAPALAPV